MNGREHRAWQWVVAHLLQVGTENWNALREVCWRAGMPWAETNDFLNALRKSGLLTKGERGGPARAVYRLPKPMLPAPPIRPQNAREGA